MNAREMDISSHHSDLASTVQRAVPAQVAPLRLPIGCEPSGDAAERRGPPQPSKLSTSTRTILSRALTASLLLLGLIVFGTGCDPSVQAVKPSPNHHYSVFGVINPGQDTQWVRIEPLPEETSQGAPAEINATVTLENLATGQTWTLRDSVMEIYRGESQHNFWTTAPIAPATQYRLVVSNSKGDTTQATTTTPATAPRFLTVGRIRLPCKNDPNDNTFEVRIGDVEELAGLRVRYFQTYLGQHLTHDFDAYEEVTPDGDDVYEALVNYFQDLRTTNQTLRRECIADSAHVVAYSGGPDWPAWAEISDLTVGEVARPDTFTNVQGGVGMFSGVYSSDTATVPAGG